MAYYAWSPILVASDDGKAQTMIKVGEEVSASKLKMDKEGFDELIEAGAVRQDKYPKTNAGEPPRTALIRQAKEQMETAMGGTGTPPPKEEKEEK